MALIFSLHLSIAGNLKSITARCFVGAVCVVAQLSAIVGLPPSTIPVCQKKKFLKDIFEFPQILGSVNLLARDKVKNTSKYLSCVPYSQEPCLCLQVSYRRLSLSRQSPLQPGFLIGKASQQPVKQDNVSDESVQE